MFAEVEALGECGLASLPILLVTVNLFYKVSRYRESRHLRCENIKNIEF